MVPRNLLKYTFLLLAATLLIVACEEPDSPEVGPLVGRWYARKLTYKATIDKQIVTDTSKTYTHGSFYRDFTEKIAYSVSIINLKTVRDTANYIYRDPQLIIYRPAQATHVDTATVTLKGIKLELSKSSSRSVKNPVSGKDEVYEETETIYFDKGF